MAVRAVLVKVKKYLKDFQMLFCTYNYFQYNFAIYNSNIPFSLSKIIFKKFIISALSCKMAANCEVASFQAPS